jgi:ribosomal protein L37E
MMKANEKGGKSVREYSPEDFIRELGGRLSNHAMPSCRFCGSLSFTVLPTFTNLAQQKETRGIVIGQSVPAATVVCTKCGHVELFALGMLGLLPMKDDESDAVEKK